MSLTKVTYSMIDGAPVNVLDFGAVGDGVADDTAAIVAACATGKKVFFPSGTYLVKSTIALTTTNSGCGFILNGSTIKKGFNGDLVTITDCADFTVTGNGKIEGQSATYSGKGFVFSGVGSIRPEFSAGIFINDFAAAHIEIGANSARYFKTYARIITGSSDLAIDIIGTDTSAGQRSIYGEIIGYVRLNGTISTFLKPTIVNRVEISSTCSVTICSGITWSNNGNPMTIDGAATIITGCRFSGNVTLNSTLSGSFIGNYLTGYTLTNNAAGPVVVTDNDNIQVGLGTTSAPSYTFRGDSDTGFWKRAGNCISVSTNALTYHEFQTERYALGSDSVLSWVDATTIPAATAYDTSLFRHSATILAVGTGGLGATNPGGFIAKFFPRTDAGASQTATGILGGTGAPNNTNGNNGDFYLRSDGGALTTIYQKRAGAWVGIV